MVKTITTVFLGIGLFLQTNAQDSTKTAAPAPATDTAKPATPPPVTITGSVDAYYRFNFNAPKGFNNNYTSFTNSQNSFELGMASIRADHSFGKVGATVDLGFGRRAQEFSYNDNGTLVAVKQAYITWQATSKLKFTMGKWGTHIGYEVLDAYANRNYSMDYMFSEGPFFHTGLKMDVTLSSTTAFMIGIANPTDFSTTTSGSKVALAQFSTGTKDGKWKFFLNYQGYGGGTGDDSTLASGYVLYKSLNQFDLVINGTITSKFGVGFNGTVQSVKSSTLGSASWWGAAAYLNFDPSSMFGLTLRGEYFSDKDGLKLKPIDQSFPITGLNVFDLTLTGLIHAGTNLTIMPEIRLDDGSKNLFVKSSDVTPTKSTFSALLAMVYHF